MHKLLVGAFLLLAATGAHAATAKATWSAVSTYADGTAIPAGTAITYNVYETGGTTPVATVSNALTVSWTVPDTCFVKGYQMTAVVGSESVRSAPVALIGAACIPGAPTGLTITLGK